MPVPPTIEVHFGEGVSPLTCGSVAELDAVLDRLETATRARLSSPDAGDPLAVTIVIPGYQIYTGLGAARSYVSVGAEPCDGEYYTAVGDATATGEGQMFVGSGQDSYWAPRHLLPHAVAREAVRYFVEHQRDLPNLRWEDQDGGDV